MKRLLVVDDDAGIRDSLELLLEPSYEVVTARDGLEALDVLRRMPVDLVLLDVLMPNLDGAGVLREMVTRGFTSPVILLSAHADLAAIAREGAPADWLAKPFEPDELERRIVRVLSDGGSGTSGGGPRRGAASRPGPTRAPSRRSTLRGRLLGVLAATPP